MESRLAINLAVVATELAVVVLVVTLTYLLLAALLNRLARVPRVRGLTDGVRRNLKVMLILVGIGLCLAIAVFDGLLIYRGEDLLQQGREWLASVPQGFWLKLAFGALEAIGVVVLATLLLRALRRLLVRGEAAARDFEQIHANDESIHAFFRTLGRVATNSTWLLALGIAVHLLHLPPAVGNGVFLALKIYLIVTLGLLIVRGIDAVIDSLDALSAKYSSPDNLLRFYDRLRVLIPLAKRCLEYIVYVWVATLAARQVALIADLARHGPPVVKIIGIFFLSRVVVEIAYLAVDELLLKRIDASSEAQQRRLTFVPLLRSTLKYAIYFGAAVLILKELGIDPTPILAGVGIAGLAVGLGAQNLINDVVSGFFILFENHFLVGDYVEIGDSRGTVEAIDLRTTRIRDPDGQMHILRNGQIGEIVNYSKQYTHAVVEVGVAYESDLDQVYRVLAETGRVLAEGNEDVLAATEVAGLDNFGESELLLRTVTRVRPGRHLPVARQFRKMVKEAFDREGIEIPYARRVLIVKDEEGVKRIADRLSAAENGRAPSGDA